MKTPGIHAAAAAMAKEAKAFLRFAEEVTLSAGAYGLPPTQAIVKELRRHGFDVELEGVLDYVTFRKTESP